MGKTTCGDKVITGNTKRLPTVVAVAQLGINHFYIVKKL
jgi:hypothetical protein